MRRGSPLPAEIEQRLASLGPVLQAEPTVHFAYLFGGAGRNELRPLSDVDVAVYLDDAADPVQARLDLVRHRFESLKLRKFLDFRIFEQRFLDARFARG